MTENFDITLAELTLKNSGSNPSALKTLIEETTKQTSIDIAPTPISISLTSPKIHQYPFTYLSGTRPLSIPSPATIVSLRRYLQHGGFLLIDNAEGFSNGPFDQSIRKLLHAALPQNRLALLKRSHVLYRSFFLLESAAGRIDISPNIEAITREGRLVAVYIKNDLGGAWAKDELGGWLSKCTPGGENQRLNAVRLGINIIMYALCLDYKEDQTHVNYILKKRHWKANDGAQSP